MEVCRSADILNKVHRVILCKLYEAGPINSFGCYDALWLRIGTAGTAPLRVPS